MSSSSSYTVKKTVTTKTGQGGTVTSTSVTTTERDGKMTTEKTTTSGKGPFEKEKKKEKKTEKGGFFGLFQRSSRRKSSSSSNSSSDSDIKKAKDKKTNINEFRKKAVKIHNEKRAKHGVGALKLNKDMCNYAQEWAEKMAKSGSFSHRPDKKYGENIYYGSNSRGLSVGDVMEAWYAEVKDYTYSAAGFAQNTGHFSQMVWKNSKEVGIGMFEPKPGTMFVVANYDPPGNITNAGQFDANVFPPK